VGPCGGNSCGWLRVDTILLMRDDDGQLMTCQQEDVSLDPADEVNASIPAICVGGGGRVGLLSTVKRHFIPTCATMASATMTYLPSSRWDRRRSRDNWKLISVATCLMTVPFLHEFSDDEI
jgi:hypothetical protein